MNLDAKHPADFPIGQRHGFTVTGVNSSVNLRGETRVKSGTDGTSEMGRRRSGKVEASVRKEFFRSLLDLSSGILVRCCEMRSGH